MGAVVAMTLTGVTSCFLTGLKTCSMGWNSYQLLQSRSKPIARGVALPWWAPATVVLLNRHLVSCLLNGFVYSCRSVLHSILLKDILILFYLILFCSGQKRLLIGQGIHSKWPWVFSPKLDLLVNSPTWSSENIADMKAEEMLEVVNKSVMESYRLYMTGLMSSCTLASYTKASQSTLYNRWERGSWGFIATWVAIGDCWLLREIDFSGVRVVMSCRCSRGLPYTWV